jgi:beta-mannosidase
VMTKQVKVLFGDVPKDLDEFIFASQAVQAEALKFFVEFWRMDKFRKTGIIWWNLRDGWPILSDAVVDYFNSKKLAYYFIRQVQQSTCVMIGDSKNGKHPVLAVNDTREKQPGSVMVRDADTANTLFSTTFIIPANGKTVIGDFPEKNIQSMWLVDYSVGKENYSNHYLNGNPPFKLNDYKRWFEKLNIIRD